MREKSLQEEPAAPIDLRLIIHCLLRGHEFQVYHNIVYTREHSFYFHYALRCRTTVVEGGLLKCNFDMKYEPQEQFIYSQFEAVAHVHGIGGAYLERRVGRVIISAEAALNIAIRYQRQRV